MHDQTPARSERKKYVYTEEKITSICNEGTSHKSKLGQMGESEFS